jgi:ADP-heptose:LPS heptosyltransferase
MKKILIIRFSSIGDIVLTTPVIRCLKNQLGAEIHFLTKKQFFPLLEANPYLSKIFTIEKKVAEVLPALKKEGYDAVVDLHKNLRSWQVRLALKKGVYSFDKLNFEKWLLVNFKINRLPNIHIVDRYLNAVKALGVKNDGQGLDYFIPKNHLPSTPEIYPELATFRPPFIAFAIGAAHQTKRLPIDKCIDICKKINLPVLLLGGKAEEQEGATIALYAGSHVSNLCGKLTLHESAQFIKTAKKVIAHDTGMMHIAAAFQKEIVVVWGNTVPAFGMAPYFGSSPKGRETRFEVGGLPCRPCSKIGFGQCPKSHFACMNRQDTEAMTQAINSKWPNPTT